MLPHYPINVTLNYKPATDLIPDHWAVTFNPLHVSLQYLWESCTHLASNEKFLRVYNNYICYNKEYGIHSSTEICAIFQMDTEVWYLFNFQCFRTVFQIPIITLWNENGWIWPEFNRDLGLFPNSIELFSYDLEQRTSDIVQSVYFSVQMWLKMNLKPSILRSCFQGIA